MENPTLAMHPPARRRIHLLSFGLALVLAAIAMLLLFLASQARAQSLSNLDDLVVTQELLRPTSDDNPTLAAAVAIDDSSPLLLPGQPATIRTRVRNAGSTPLRVTLGLLPQRIEADSTDELSCPPYCCLTCTLQLAGNNPALSQIGSVEIQDFRSFPLPPGAERVFDRPVLRMEQEVSDELTLDPPALTVFSDVDVCLAEGSTSCPDPLQNPSLTKRSTLEILVVRADFGDAPDSSNHAAAAMSAYPGIPAQYPTVFDPATGAPSGPVHTNPGPFHLGAQVSLEIEADLGPDQDPRNNIVPAAAAANNDRFDDGIRPAALNFVDCQAATFDVAVFIHPTMKADLLERGVERAYLNAWLDGNRDGDWQDVRQCSNATAAIEHMVIDRVIDIAALQPGINLLTVTGGPAPWPDELAQRPAWLRLMLSEAPSTKTGEAGDVRYGDGRGAYAGGLPTVYRTGETEDYLINRRDQAGADVAVRMQANQIYDGGPRVAWSIEYRNLGDAGASAVTLSTGDIPGELLGARSAPQLTPSNNGDQLRFNIGALEPGAGGRILLQTDAPDLSTELYTLTVTIAADSDTNPGNNEARAGVRAGLPAPLMVGPGDGTTCSPDVTVSGQATPGATVRLRVNGEPVQSSATADNEGNWSIDLQELSDGPQLIEAIAQFDGRFSPISRPLRVLVDSTLPYDPLSLLVTDPNGNSYRPLDANGRSDAAGWRLRFPVPGTYSISVRSCCETPGAQISIDFANLQLPDIVLNDSDNDGVYSGDVTVPAGTMTSDFILIVVCSGVSSDYPGSAESMAGGVISDAISGEPLGGAEVLLLVQRNSSARSNDAMSDESQIFEPWPATAFGQQNPQTTGSDGRYSFFPPTGVYRVLVRRDGYYTYRSAVFNQNMTLAANVFLIPRIDEPATRQVAIGPDGFDETLLTVRPGEVIELINLDTDERSFLSRQADDATALAAVAVRDSGAISPGGSYKISYAEAGTYFISDGANGFDNLTIIVDPQAGGERVYLPLVVRPQ